MWPEQAQFFDYKKDSFRSELVIHHTVHLFSSPMRGRPQVTHQSVPKIQLVSSLKKNGAHWHLDQCFTSYLLKVPTVSVPLGKRVSAEVRKLTWGAEVLLLFWNLICNEQILTLPLV